MGELCISNRTLMPVFKCSDVHKWAVVQACFNQLSQILRTPNNKAYGYNLLTSNSLPWYAWLQHVLLKENNQTKPAEIQLLFNVFNLWYDSSVWYRWHFECSTANSPRQDIFGQAQTKEQQRCCNGTLKPLIPLLMHSYKYSTSKNLSCCRPSSTQGMQSRTGIYY